MKKKEAAALLLVGILLSGIIAAAATEAGSAANPLITLDWLRNTFIPGSAEQAGDRAGERLDELAAADKNGSELRLKRADVLWLESGSTLTPLAGSLSLAAGDGGAVVDVTEGVERSEGEAVTNHRYLAAEDTRAAFSVTSDTAVVRLIGPYQLSPSGSTDYNAMADALNALGLFQGSDVPYGKSYELETVPTRIQGLVMFLRLMGEETYALNYPGSGITFADVPSWAEPYVAYAYDKGYTKGQAVDEQWRVVFGSQDSLAPKDYMTFLLRALGYSEGEDFTWLGAIEDAQRLGCLREGEAAFLTGRPFLRAQVVYLSCAALSAQTPGGERLADRLADAGIFETTLVDEILPSLENQRM